MKILGIETSCDETAAAVLKVTGSRLWVLANKVSSQVALHRRWDGVVPELAARRHAEVIIPLLKETFRQAHTDLPKIDLIAVTAGPGLITALQVGVETAKALAWILKKPLVAVNHIAGHLASPFLATRSWPLATSKKIWPAVALVVSGGHTELYFMTSTTNYRLLGRTLDDAAGEAFDKVAKMLKLPYPGGPQVARLAEQGNIKAFNFPRPMINSKNYHFSFAGLKTAVLYALQKQKLGTRNQWLVANICASFQQAAVEVLIAKTIKAAEEYRVKTILLGGGVSANQLLRRELTRAVGKLTKVKLMISPLKYTGDNAAMIALAGYLETSKYGLKGYRNTWKKINANANWELW